MESLEKISTLVYKRCHHCGVIKLIFDFYADRTRKDGYANVCKLCALARGRAYQKTDMGKKAHNRANKRYFESPKGQACRKRDYQLSKAKGYFQSPACIMSQYRYRASEKGRNKIKERNRKYLLFGCKDAEHQREYRDKLREELGIPCDIGAFIPLARYLKALETAEVVEIKV